MGWCNRQRSVRAVLLLGSMARAGGSDELSDLDFLVVTTRHRRFLDPCWLESLDPPPLFCWTYHPPLGGDLVHQAVFDGPLVVDIAPLSKTQAVLTGISIEAVHRLPLLRRVLPGASSKLDAWLRVAALGTKVLLDKDGVTDRMLRRVGQGPDLRKAPGNREFLNTVYSVFGLCLWESKQLARGELWMALGTVDQQLKACLLQMLEWHALATSREPVETWYGGRKLQAWADARWTAGAQKTWPTFERDAAWDALTSTLELFSQVAAETAEAFGYRYPKDREQDVQQWLSDRRSSSRS